jgi:hypothetical protein
VPLVEMFARFSFCEESFRFTVAIATLPRTHISFHGSLIPLDGIEIALSSASMTRSLAQSLAETSL